MCAFFLGWNLKFRQHVLQTYAAACSCMNLTSFLVISSNDNNGHSISLEEANQNHAAGRIGEHSNVQDARAAPNFYLFGPQKKHFKYRTVEMDQRR